MDSIDEIPVAEYLKWVNQYQEVINHGQMPNNGTMTDSFSMAGELLTCSLDYFHAHKNNKRLVRVLTTTDCEPEDEAKKCVQQFLQKCPDMESECQELITVASGAQVADEALIKRIKTSMMKTANKTLVTSASASFVCVIIEGTSLIGFWREVLNAKEFSSGELVEQIEDIQENVDEISVEIKKLVEEIHGSNFESMNGEERYWFHSRKAGKLDSIRRNIDRTFTDIGNLRAEVNGRIERLSSITENANNSAIVQGVQGVRQTGITVLNRGTASYWTLAATGITAIFHFTASISNIFLARESKDTIKQLRAKLGEIRKFRKKLAKMLKELDNHFEAFTHAICPRNEKITLEQICAA